MQRGNLYLGIPAALPDERVEALVESDGLRIERIVSLGHRSPEGFWYDQERDEWVVLLSGRARLELEDEAEPLEMAPGDWVRLPAHARHRVAWTDPDRPTIWLAAHFTASPSGRSGGPVR